MCAMMWILEKTLCTGKCILSVLNSFSVKKKKTTQKCLIWNLIFFFKINGQIWCFSEGLETPVKSGITKMKVPAHFLH